MDNTQRTLANVSGTSVDPNTITRSYNTYLTFFGIQLAYRFPDVNLENIDSEIVEQIARFSAVCTNIAFRVWDDVSTESTRYRRKVS